MELIKTPEASAYPGYTIRLVVSFLLLLEGLSAPFNLPTLNRLLAAMVMDIIDLCQFDPVQVNPRSLVLLAVKSRLDLAIWQQLDREDIRRSRPNAETKPLKLTFSGEQRTKIAGIARRLRWAEGQVVVESIAAFCKLAAAEPLLDELPDIIRIARAESSYVSDDEGLKESAASVLGQLNIQLGLISRPNLDHPEPPQPSRETKSELPSFTQSVFSDAPGYVPEIETPKTEETNENPE